MFLFYDKMYKHFNDRVNIQELCSTFSLTLHIRGYLGGGSTGRYVEEALHTDKQTAI